MKLYEAFEHQAKACAALGSPFMGRLLQLLARHWPADSRLGRICLDWPGDVGPGQASLPLRIAGGLHALVLGGQDETLSAAYPPNRVSDDILIAAVLAAMARNEPFLLDWIQSPPQTNEVRRSAAIIPAAHWLAARHPLPIVTSELGASGGLNLMWDRFAVQAGDHRLGPDDAALVLRPDWRGQAPDCAQITVAERRGVDLNPLNPNDPEHALRLSAYLWPDQPERLALTQAAIAAQRDATVDCADAIDWLEQRLSIPRPGHLHLIYHTIAWQYFAPDGQARGAEMIRAAGAAATNDAPLAWLRMENDGVSDGAALDLRLWPGNYKITLGRADFHGRWIAWNASPPPPLETDPFGSGTV